MSPELLVAIGTLIGSIAVALVGVAIRLWDKWSQSAQTRHRLNRASRKDVLDELSDLIDELRTELNREKRECRESIDAMEKEIQALRQGDFETKMRLYRAERHIEYLQDSCEREGLTIKRYSPEEDSRQHKPVQPNSGEGDSP